jgi:autotransporter-associated beta strand protein
MSASRRKQLKRWFVVLCAAVMSQRAAAQGLIITRHFNVGLDIPDAGELVNVQNLGVGGGSIANLQVMLSVSGRGDGGWNGDLYAAVGHDTGYSVLLNRPGKRAGKAFGYGDSGLNVTFDDSAANGDIHSYRQTLNGSHATALGGSLTGSWAPDGRLVNPSLVGLADSRTALLSGFNGLSADGEWRLHVADMSSGGTHHLESWGVKIETTSAPSGTIALGGDTIEGKNGPQSLSNPVTLGGSTQVGGSENLTFSGEIAGAGGFTHGGSGQLKLTGHNAFTGGVHVQNGTLVVGNDRALGTGTLNLAGGALQGEGGTREIDNSVQVSGNVRFSGNDALRFTGSTSLSGQRTLTVENSTTFGGGLTEGESGSGLVKAGGGTLIIAGASSYSGPTVVNGGHLVVNNSTGSGTGSGHVTVSSGGTLGGGGIISGAVTVSSGGRLAPGNSPGTLSTGDATWEGAGSYVWDINDVNAGTGTDPGWDLHAVTGTLTIAATSESKFNLLITSLTLGNTAGAVHDFSGAQSYSWKLAEASSGIVGFDPVKFNLDRSAFANSAPGSFSLSQAGNDLYLNYTAVPEPGAMALLTGLGLTGFALWRRRRQ